MSHGPEDLRVEVASLRRQVRILLVLAVLAVLFAALALRHANRPPQRAGEADPAVLVGRSLYLRDHPDEPYVRLRQFQDGAGMILADAEGRSQVQIKASPGRGRVLLGSGPPRVVLEGDRLAPSLTLTDARGRPRIVLSAGEPPRIALLGPGGDSLLELRAEQGGELCLNDASGRPRVQVGQVGKRFRVRVLGDDGKVTFETPQP